ncbi:site-specific integrase [Candidatus Synechococcus calcipolaris G9]|uniref:Site-specific integrase n=1 Tax=Candidatus Synechococcus calcipolaris G9 TaxID=1497997 RepID=A0ABT6EZ60_9SYNE|nr:site-specific integrase [Candidatus Synechococcus calcipolaris]MDG2990740.1 site-specific integrase [Candidatus Synechococcus calcipolaris G9]
MKRGKNATIIGCSDLFERFTRHIAKDKGLSPGSIHRYKGCLSHVRRSLDVDADLVDQRRAGNFASILRETVSDRTAKEYLWLLESCWNWAKDKYRLADSNPWQGLAAKIRPHSTQKVKPFTEGEVIEILEAFKSDRHYRHYYPMVCFLFGSGCRFGEAAALQWKHLSQGFSTAWIGETISRGHHRRTTKTGKAREVVLSPGLAGLLAQVYDRRSPKPDDLVFPAPHGGSMSDQLFRKRAWKTILDRLGIDYRKPYSTRHTAVSHALANGANPLMVATQAGHNPAILYKSYASVIENRSIFVEFS